MPLFLQLNIRHGGSRRVVAIADRLAEYRPDVVVLTEFRANSHGEVLLRRLAGAGLIHHRVAPAGARTNAVAVVSRHPLSQGRWFTELGPNQHRLLEVEVLGVTLLGLYMPMNYAKAPVFEFLIRRQVALGQLPALLLGDLNTGKRYVDEEGATFIVPHYLDRMDALGWVDLWRRFHGERREYSWYSPKGNGFRIDHAFASASLAGRVVEAAYSHDEREAGLSDHSLLRVKLD